MIATGRLHRWTGWGVLGVTLAVYLQTMAPSVSFWDCGEFIACSWTLGVPHPPGSPLYVLLGRLFTLVPVGEVAARVVSMSALASALAAWCVYLTTVALARRALGGQPLTPLADRGSELAAVAGGAVAALTLAFSYTQWFNATEAEVYGYSILFTCLGVWLGLYWDGRGAGPANDRWLLLLAYLFGLGGGLHLLCLLTIPALLVLAWFAEGRLRRLIVLLGVLGVWVGLAMAVGGSGSTSYGLALLGIGGALVYLYRHDRRGCYLLGGMGLLFVLGYSTYGLLYERSGLQPAIDMNDPQDWDAFVKFVNREQYGSESMLLSMLTPKASRGYQFWDLQMKYFFQQFPFPLLNREVVFRKATEAAADPVSISLVPYLLGLWGLVWHGWRDWRRFVAFAAMFVIMGFGLSLYLNMPDPQPRERHYVFGGMYYAFALWLGLGWTGLVEEVRSRLRWGWRPLAAVAAFGLVVPVGVVAKLYPVENRTGDYIAYDYGYNLLQSCEPNSVLFTNGDNDTFPLWFLQQVEGVRKDVTVVNLSLLNTNWYIKQLRDRPPKVDIRYTDTFIDSVLTDTQDVDVMKRYWPKPQPVSAAGLEWELPDMAGYQLLRVQDIMVLKIIDWNQWQRPIQFAITIPTSNLLNLGEYLTMHGMVLTLGKTKNRPMDRDGVARLLYEGFRLRGLNDPTVHKDEETLRLLGNYRAIVSALAGEYKKQGSAEEMSRLHHWAEEHLPKAWETAYTAALDLQAVGRNDEAAEFMEKAGQIMLERVGQDPHATYDNLCSIADVLQGRYNAATRAESLYRRIALLKPERPEAPYGLAASLQVQGRNQECLEVVEAYVTRYGEQGKMGEARRLLRQSMGLVAAPDSQAQR